MRWAGWGSKVQITLCLRRPEIFLEILYCRSGQRRTDRRSGWRTARSEKDAARAGAKSNNPKILGERICEHSRQDIPGNTFSWRKGPPRAFGNIQSYLDRYAPDAGIDACIGPRRNSSISMYLPFSSPAIVFPFPLPGLANRGRRTCAPPAADISAGPSYRNGSGWWILSTLHSRRSAPVVA